MTQVPAPVPAPVCCQLCLLPVLAAREPWDSADLPKQRASCGPWAQALFVSEEESVVHSLPSPHGRDPGHHHRARLPGALGTQGSTPGGNGGSLKLLRALGLAPWGSSSLPSSRAACQGQGWQRQERGIQPGCPGLFLLSLGCH